MWSILRRIKKRNYLKFYLWNICGFTIAIISSKKKNSDLEWKKHICLLTRNYVLVPRSCIGLIGRNQLRFIFTKTEWLWVFDSQRSGEIPSLTLDGIAFPLSRLACNLKVFLDSQLLLEEQVSAMARKTFVQLHLVVAPFPRSGGSHDLVPSQLDYCNILYMGQFVKTTQKKWPLQNCYLFLKNFHKHY